MTDSKKNIALIFGGRSAEHEVSLVSAKNVFKALDKDKYSAVLIGISKAGKWHLVNEELLLSLNEELFPSLEELQLGNPGEEVIFAPGDSNARLVSLESKEVLGTVDVVFPVLHGPYGEDGTIQGYFEIMNVPFVGPGVLGAAVGMDKDVTKRLLREAGISTSKSLAFHTEDRPDYESTRAVLGDVLFVKPANMGSSVGISKATDRSTFDAAVELAFRFDKKVIVEEFISGRELECSVLDGENLIASSVIGEIIPEARHGFYSYEAKYMDADGAKLQIPADLPDTTVEQIQKMSKETFRVLCLRGMARVDFFLTDDNRLLINEANTIPGFTKISMYPALLKESGIEYKDLVDKLIQLGLERSRGR